MRTNSYGHLALFLVQLLLAHGLDYFCHIVYDVQHAYNALSSCRNALLSTLTTLALESHARKSRSMWRFSCNVLYVLTVGLRFVETKYKLEIGAAQTTQLSKAIINGAEKGVFVLPKG